MQWNFAADTWQCPSAVNDLQPGGRFSWRMEAKDQSMGFDYAGTYEEIMMHQKIVARLDDNRQVTVTFDSQGPATTSPKLLK
nr:SRPBCC domain-containing protein [Rufibacter sp. LB8]